MDRLELMIARLVTQRACLGYAARALAGLDGPILEVGLGKGRTYDHLRTLFPGRAIHAFDRDIHAPGDCVPPDGLMHIGDFRETLPRAVGVIGRTAVLAHADIGTSKPDRDVGLATAIAPLLVQLVQSGGLVMTDREMSNPALCGRPLPPDAGDWPYYLYEVCA